MIARLGSQAAVATEVGIQAIDNTECEQVMFGETAAGMDEGRSRHSLHGTGVGQAPNGEVRLSNPAKTRNLAAVFVGLASLAPLQQADATESSSVSELLRYACTEVAGEFEEGWIFDRSGAYWFETAACITSELRLSCNDGECMAIQRAIPDDPSVMVKNKASADLGSAVYPDRNEFDRVLRGGRFY